MNKLTCRVAVAVAGLGGQAVAGIINVLGDQPTIQAGIDAAVDGDEVIVADGACCSIIRSIIVRPASYIELRKCLPVNRTRTPLDRDFCCPGSNS